MDGRAAISNNIEALKRILAGLFAMAGLARFSSPLAGEDGSARQGKAEPLAEPGEGSDGRPTLPRYLRLAILRILRPAEAAARRLIIASARGLVVTSPPARKTAPKPVDPAPLLRRFGIAVVLAADDVARTNAGTRSATPPARPRSLTLPLFDPPRRFTPFTARHVPAYAAPRVLFPGVLEPYRLPPAPSPDDPVDTSRLGHRLAALATALDDLPGQARRFARLRARQRKPASGRVQRASPLRPGRPPGGRLSRFDPSATRRADIRDIDEVLAHAHALALYALQYPDTS